MSLPSQEWLYELDRFVATYEEYYEKHRVGEEIDRYLGGGGSQSEHLTPSFTLLEVVEADALVSHIAKEVVSCLL